MTMSFNHLMVILYESKVTFLGKIEEHYFFAQVDDNNDII